MTVTQILKYIWDGVDVPVTQEEIQHTVNVATWALKKGLTEDEDIKKINDIYETNHKTLNIECNN